jgi:hypothetical protein
MQKISLRKPLKTTTGRSSLRHMTRGYLETSASTPATQASPNMSSSLRRVEPSILFVKVNMNIFYRYIYNLKIVLID